MHCSQRILTRARRVPWYEQGKLCGGEDASILLSPPRQPGANSVRARSVRVPYEERWLREYPPIRKTAVMRSPDKTGADVCTPISTTFTATRGGAGITTFLMCCPSAPHCPALPREQFLQLGADMVGATAAEAGTRRRNPNERRRIIATEGQHVWAPGLMA